MSQPNQSLVLTLAQHQTQDVAVPHANQGLVHAGGTFQWSQRLRNEEMFMPSSDEAFPGP